MKTRGRMKMTQVECFTARRLLELLRGLGEPSQKWVEVVAATFNQNLVEVIKRKVVANLRPIIGCGGWWAWPLSLGVAAACLAVWRRGVAIWPGLS